jgi:hypothetical protein
MSMVEECLFDIFKSGLFDKFKSSLLIYTEKIVLRTSSSVEYLSSLTTTAVGGIYISPANDTYLFGQPT